MLMLSLLSNDSMTYDNMKYDNMTYRNSTEICHCRTVEIAASAWMVYVLFTWLHSNFKILGSIITFTKIIFNIQNTCLLLI